MIAALGTNMSTAIRGRMRWLCRGLWNKTLSIQRTRMSILRLKAFSCWNTTMSVTPPTANKIIYDSFFCECLIQQRFYLYKVREKWLNTLCHCHSVKCSGIMSTTKTTHSDKMQFYTSQRFVIIIKLVNFCRHFNCNIYTINHQLTHTPALIISCSLSHC